MLMRSTSDWRPRLLVALTLSTSPAIAAQSESPVLLELYTSQGCSSCPAADEVLRALDNASDGVVALEFHVDYWDSLVWGASGQWKDPFSKAEFSARQRLYNRNEISGRKGVYTPQVIIQGDFAAVGHRKNAIRRQVAKQPESGLNIRWEQSESGYRVSLDGKPRQQSSVWLARFVRDVETQVLGGENDGKKLHNHNVVTQLEKLMFTENNVINIDRDGDPATGCAVFVQAENQGRVMAASYCPDDVGSNE